MVYCDLCDISIMLCDRMCSRVHRLCHLAVSQQFAKRILRWRRPPPAVLKLEKEREFERGERDLSASFLCFLFSPIARCPRIFLLTTSSRLQSEERTIKAKQRQKGGNDHGKEGEVKLPNFPWGVSSLEVFQPTSFFSGQKYFISPF